MQSGDKTFVISISHEHGDELSVSSGRLEARDADDAIEKSEPWVTKTMRECKCESHGDQCGVYAQKAYAGLKSTMLACSAEDIE